MRLSKLVKYFLLLIFLILGFLLRAQETISHNFLFLLDQGRDMMAVREIVFGHHLTLIGPYTSLQGVFQGPLWYYVLSLPTFLLHGDPWGGVILMLVISFTVLLMSFFCMKQLFGIDTAVTTVFFIAICPEAVAAATYAWNPHPMWLLLSMFIFSFFMLQQGEKTFHVFVWPIIACMFHFEAALAIFIFLEAFMYLLIFKRNVFYSWRLFIGCLLAGLFFLPQVFFELRHKFLMTKSFLALLHGSKQGLLVGGESNQYLHILSDHLQAFVINYNSSFLFQGVLQYTPLLFFILFQFVSVVSVSPKRMSAFFSDKEKTFIRCCFMQVILVVLLTLAYPFPLRYWFLTGFELFYLLPLGLIIGKLVRYRIGFVLMTGYLALVFFVDIQHIYTLYEKPDYGGVAKIKGKTDAVNFIYRDAHGTKFSLFIFDPPVYTDPYDYLVWYYGKNIYHYLPLHEKKGIAYLLIEPDPVKPWSYQGWLDTVIKSGTVLSTTTLGSGLIVQKRLF